MFKHSANNANGYKANHLGCEKDEVFENLITHLLDYFFSLTRLFKTEIVN